MNRIFRNNPSGTGELSTVDLAALVDALGEHISPQRLEKIRTVASRRTRYLKVVLADIYYTQNISAVVRSCECFGIQDVYVCGRTPSAKINKHVAIGASHWVSLHRHNGVPPVSLLQELLRDGYRLAAAVPGAETVSLYDFDIDAGKTAVILGNEMEGLAPEVLELATDRITIPMRGFSDSFNISVSAAIILGELCRKLHASGRDHTLSPREILELEYLWIKASLKRGEEVSRQYHRQLYHPNDQII